eukprot:89538_1
MSIVFSHTKQLQLATEFKQSNNNVIVNEDQQHLSSSDSVEICYNKSSSFKHSIHSNDHTPINIDDDDESICSSHYEEDEDSKMMELPILSHPQVTKINSIKLSLSPNNSRKIKYSPIKYQSTKNQMKQHNKHKTDINQFQVVNSINKCTLNAVKYQNSQIIFSRINCTYSHYWKRLSICFSLGILICCIIAFILTFYGNIWKYSFIFVVLIPFIIFCLFLFRLCLKY